MKIKLEMESMGSKLSKTGLRMFLRCLDQNLESQVAPSIFTKNRENRTFGHNYAIKLHQNIKSVLKTF